MENQDAADGEREALGRLVALSRSYGAGDDYVIAGGGNTSWKDRDVLYVKGSGQAMADISAEGFVRMERSALAAVWRRSFPDDEAEREKLVLEGLLAARSKGHEGKRPSVETLLHDLLPFSYVVHSHPSLANAIACGKQGKAAFMKLFAEDGVWIPLVNPGYVLALAVQDAVDAFRAKNGRAPWLIFMENHGIVVSGDDPETIRAKYSSLFDRIRSLGVKSPELSDKPIGNADEAAFAAALETLARDGRADERLHVLRETGGTAMGLSADDGAFAAIGSAFTPDHIVYMGVAPIRVDGPNDLAAEWKDFEAAHGKAPRVVLAKGLGAFCLGSSPKAADRTLRIFRDGLKISLGSESFGGPKFMEREFIDFIKSWEVESYRGKVSDGA